MQMHATEPHEAKMEPPQYRPDIRRHASLGGHGAAPVLDCGLQTDFAHGMQYHIYTSSAARGIIG